MHRACFNTHQHLRTAQEFRQLFRRGKKIIGKHYSCFLIRNQETYARLGVVVSKKTSKRAVKRNLIRRIAKEAFRHYQHTIPGHDLVILAHKRAAEVTKQELHQCLKTLFEKRLSV